MMSISRNKIFIALLILTILVVSYFLFGKKLIYPPRASEALRIYNIDSRSGEGFTYSTMPTRTVRWKTLPVKIYNKADVPYLKDILEEWNAAMGRQVFIEGGADSPIVVDIDSSVPRGEFFRYFFNQYSLTEFKIINHPDWITPARVKHQLGHALGFFGHTVEDSQGIMDADHSFSDGEVLITPFVVSVLKELYYLPPGSKYKNFSSAYFSLKKEAQRYNVDSRENSGPYTPLPTGTLRWRIFPVAVYNQANIFDLENILEDWNKAMGQQVFAIGEKDAPISIEIDENALLVEINEWQSQEPNANYLLKKFRIIYNPAVITPARVKHQLGHALGFLGDTTEDEKGIMDRDYDRLEGASITPFVVSVLKELYRLPPGTHIITINGQRFTDLINIRKLVKKYNIEPRSQPNVDVRTVRWRNLPVAVYNEAGVINFQAIIDGWNQVMDQDVFKIGGPESPIVIKKADFEISNPYYGMERWQYKHYLFTDFQIFLRPDALNLDWVTKLHLGRALGLFGYKEINENQAVISSSDVSVLKELYYLPPGTLINY